MGGVAMRAFVGIPVPETPGIKRALDFLNGFDVSRVRPETLHVTADFFKEITEKGAEQVRKIMDGFRGSGSFMAEMGGIGAFRDKGEMKAIYANVTSPEMESLIRAVKAKTYPESLKNPKPLIPHVTLARVRKGQPDGIGDVFKIGGLGSFEANRLKFFECVPGPDGYMYEELYAVHL